MNFFIIGQLNINHRVRKEGTKNTEQNVRTVIFGVNGFWGIIS